MNGRAPIAIETEFDWASFVQLYWEQRPVLFKRLSAGPFDSQDAFRAAAEAGRVHLERSYSGGARPNVQFTVERKQQSFLRPTLPLPTDGSLAGYARRMARELGRRRYALVISGFHSFWYPLWASERSFLAGLWRRVGLPLTGAITTLFHGNYEHTPSGVHRDRFTTFLFALEGQKRMRFWPERPWSEPVSTMVDYERYLDRSFAVDVEPGDLLYWPASYYHVGESVGREVATSVNVGVPRTEHRPVYYLDDLLLGTIDEIDLSDEERRRARLGRVNGSPLVRGALTDRPLPAALPLPLRQAIRAFVDVSRPAASARHVRTLWLRRTTAAGLEPAPEPARRSRLADGDRVRADRRFPIAWARDGARELLCSANGHAVRVAGHADVARMLAALNTGRAACVADLVRPFRATGSARRSERIPATRAGMKLLLEKLCSFRALERSAGERRRRRGQTTPRNPVLAD
jgi:50S ribosomal protein L16 3-hydroxylase